MQMIFTEWQRHRAPELHDTHSTCRRIETNEEQKKNHSIMPIRGTNILSMFGVDFISAFFILFVVATYRICTKYICVYEMCSMYATNMLCVVCMHIAYAMHVFFYILYTPIILFARNRIIKRSLGTNSFAITYFLRVVYCFSFSMSS